MRRYDFFIVTILYFPAIGSEISPGITKEKVLELKLGMDKEAVINIMGTPIEIVDKDNSGCDHDGNGCSLIYARPGLYRTEFEFYLNIINNKLVGIHVERDDLFVYSCFKNDCPGIIRTEDFEELTSYSLNQSKK